jgi:hypothetical protein
MAKSNGLASELFIGGYQLSGDIQSVDNISSPVATLDVTGINKSAYERILGLRDGMIDVTTFFNTSAGQAHPVLSVLPETDTHVMYCHKSVIGNPAACLVAKQLNYDGSRAADAGFTFKVQAQGNAYGLEWCQQLTAGLRTDTAATNGSSLDTGASASFGGQFYLQCTDFDGTDVTVKIQDSADNSNWADVTGGSFTQITSAPTFERIALSNTATIRRYVRAVTVTSGGVTSVSFVVAMNKNETAGVVF